ncbi:MAG: DUF6065 family protein [Polyangiaceae bacterium]|jgi:hypothetical protein|nr:DUF6065 family protein [Polyangiaceae bacterium]
MAGEMARPPPKDNPGQRTPTLDITGAPRLSGGDICAPAPARAEFRAPKEEPKPQVPTLTCYSIAADPPILRPGPPTREWMDETREGYAYRCLPLSIANGHGWEVLNPSPFEATWRGNTGTNGVLITSLDDSTPLATSHFGHGVLTFHIHALFRTDPGVNLWVSGPSNHPKHGIQPLQAVVETDWTYATFTMNWLFTAPGTVRFDRDEPFCFFFPVSRGGLNAMEPELRSVADDRATYEGYVAWRTQRADFLRELPIAGTEAHEAGWEKTYFQGVRPNKTKVADHQTKLRLKAFNDLRGKRQT